MRRLAGLLVAIALCCSYGFARSGRHSSGTHASKPHSGKAKTRGAGGSRSGVHYRRNYVAEGFTLHPSVQRGKHGRIKRSEAAKSAFKRQHPCPATGTSTGRCPGYVVDHVRALECGGADDPGNMQWQSAAAAKAKDRTERYCR